ncbi:MAG: SAM-dependent methyltransferase [Planctomycetota bacterium]|jgi:hypothetical protein
MVFTLEQVVPWGRSYEEYVSMFSLLPEDLAKSILGCADGPAAFNAVLSASGGSVVSCDPLYSFSAEQIKGRIAQTSKEVLAQTEANKQEFVWTSIKSVAELGKVRMSAMEEFLKDYAGGAKQNRYVAAELPSLPFADNSFELALCSHFLFLYSQQYTADFHVDAICELCRTAEEVRIFPLVELGSVKSRHLDIVISTLIDNGFNPEIVKVDYEFQKTGNEMLVVT